MMRVCSFCGLLIVCLVFSCRAFGQTPPATNTAKNRQPVHKVERAVWNESAGTYFGISHDDFASMGLSKLTPDEYSKLLEWASRRENEVSGKAKEEGISEQKAILAITPTYLCGRKLEDEGAAAKVNLLIEGNDENPSELMSGLRQRLRSIPDVQIVYDVKDADLVVNILGFEVKPEGGGSRGIGYAASLATASPCISKVGTTEWNFRMMENHILQTSGREIKAMVEEIVTAIDSKDIESKRQEHAVLAKYLRGIKK